MALGNVPSARGDSLPQERSVGLRAGFASSISENDVPQASLLMGVTVLCRVMMSSTRRKRMSIEMSACRPGVQGISFACHTHPGGRDRTGATRPPGEGPQYCDGPISGVSKENTVSERGPSVSYNHLTSINIFPILFHRLQHPPSRTGARNSCGFLRITTFRPIFILNL